MKDSLMDGPERQRLMLGRLVEACVGVPADVVLGAAVNLVANAVRQAHGKRGEAEKAFDERMRQAKTLLLEHYDPVTGVRRSVTPFTQEMVLPFFKNASKLGDT